MPLPFIAPLLLRLPWLKWVGIGVLAVALISFGLYFRSLQVDSANLKAAEKATKAARADLDTEKAARISDAIKYTAKVREEQERSQRYAKMAGEMQTMYEDLAKAVVGAKITKESEVKPNEAGMCTVTTRNDTYRLCHNAAWSLDPADRAACEASAGNATSGRLVPAAPAVQPAH